MIYMSNMTIILDSSLLDAFWRFFVLFWFSPGILGERYEHHYDKILLWRYSCFRHLQYAFEVGRWVLSPQSIWISSQYPL
jgi:hypothetical protein